MIGARIAALALMASLALLLSGLVALAAGLHGGVLVWSGLAMSAGAALAARDTLAPGAFGRGLMLALYTALCLAILAVVDGLMEHRRARYDWTQDRVFTLSDITRRVLGNLQGDVQLTVVYGASSPGRHLARDLLKQYQLASSRLRVRFLDPDLEPSEARRFGDAVQGGIVLEHSGRRKVVHRVEERELTLAMNALASREQAVIAFLAGPGQPSPDDRGVLGYTLAAAALEKENYRVVSVDSAQAVVGTTPVLLIVPYGKRDLSGEAATGIEALRLRGSSVLLLAEPGEERPILRGIVEK
ncbi:MAG: GldG family protein, partial [Candidatus Wallbacteria bacterium]|nr:GldG family protein [Candidatus Wallbacteria bacterium]